MISIQQALEIIKKNLPEPVRVKLDLSEAVDHYLADDIRAPEASPRFTNSAMDGFAVRWRDVKHATSERPVILKIVGESRAGVPFAGQINQGEAIRISTGAMLAGTADTVIRVEDTLVEADRLTILAVRKQGQDIRYKGEEFEVGALLVHKRTKISAPQIALLASVGIDRVEVYRPCEVALLTTGSEFVATGATIQEYQIRDSNMAMLTTAIREAGAIVVFSKRIIDDRDSTIAAIGQATIAADIVLCAGGVSVGRHDYVKEAAEANGFAPLFWRIRQKPGKPLYFARQGKTLLFGLPGNPVSAFMCFVHYVRPIISALGGQPFGWPTASAQACVDITNNGKRTNLIRVQITWRPNDGYCIAGLEKQGSHMLTSLADADGYIILEPGETLKNGERVDVYRYEFRRESV